MDITVYLPDDIAAEAKANRINLSGVLRRGVQAELLSISGFEMRLKVLADCWAELPGEITEDEAAALLKLLRSLRELRNDVPDTSVALRVSIGELMAKAENALVGEPA